MYVCSCLVCAYLLEVNVSAGMTAKGSCIDMTALRMSFIPVRSLMSEKKATEKVGTMAMDRVRRTRCQRFQRMFKKPSMAN